MATTMEKTVFTPAQREVIDVMACLDSKEDLTELKLTLVRFLNERMQREMDKLWDDGAVSERHLNEWRTTHLRTPYKQQ